MTDHTQDAGSGANCVYVIKMYKFRKQFKSPLYSFVPHFVDEHRFNLHLFHNPKTFHLRLLQNMYIFYRKLARFFTLLFSYDK